MSTKLTLTIGKSVIERAKKCAKSQGRSLSNLIEEYLKSVSGDLEEQNEVELSPEIKSLYGSVEDKNIDYREMITDVILKKYLR